jgi:hypothetical protein
MVSGLRKEQDDRGMEAIWEMSLIAGREQQER